MSNDAKAKNEALFRDVNERIEAVSQSIPSDDETMEFLCECDRADCRDSLSASRAEYESVRAVPTRFLVLPGHSDSQIEHVDFSNERFLVVEKEGTAAARAEETDPRDRS